MVSGSIVVDFNLTDKRTVGLAANISNNPRINETIDFADGTGQGQANRLYGYARTIPGGGVDSVDLNGVLSDAFGGTISLARAKGIVIYNNPGNGDLTIGGGSNAVSTLFSAAGTITIKQDGVFLIATSDATAYGITANTAHILQVAGTAGQTYVIGILGANA